MVSAVRLNHIYNTSQGIVKHNITAIYKNVVTFSNDLNQLYVGEISFCELA